MTYYAIFSTIELTEAQLLITGLLTGLGVVGLLMRWLVSSPERESAAYKSGVSDEQIRCQEDIRELRAHALAQADEIRKLRDGLLRLAVASDLSTELRAEIAHALGFSEMSKMVADPTPPPMRTEEGG